LCGCPSDDSSDSLENRVGSMAAFLRISIAIPAPPILAAHSTLVVITAITRPVFEHSSSSSSCSHGQGAQGSWVLDESVGGGFVLAVGSQSHGS